MIKSQGQRATRALSRRSLSRAALALTAAGAFVAQAAWAPGGAGAQEADEEAGGPASSSGDVAVPTVTGPVEGEPFLAMPAGVRETYDGYVEEEYFIEGEATAYEAEGGMTEDGQWTVNETSTTPYKTRILVRRPADPAEFDGSVFVEWYNVSGGIDFDADFSLGHHEILRNGSVHIGVSAQKVGADFLPTWQQDGARYESVEHPGDEYSYDIYSQAAQAIRGAGGVDVLGGLTPEVVIGMGESQSAARMATYVNGVHPVAGVYDAFLVHSRGGGSASLAAGGSPIGEGVVYIRDDIDVPVLQLQTESDVVGMGFAGARQEDTDLIRTWEIAGTSHADGHILEYSVDLSREMIGFSVLDLCANTNKGPHNVAVRGAFAALRKWAATGEPPAEAPRLELDDSNAIGRDELGIALGGVRTPHVDAPIAVHTSETSWWNLLCGFFGETRPLDAATLRDLYPTHQDYVDAVTESANAGVANGFLARADADAMIAEAEEADVPPGDADDSPDDEGDWWSELLSRLFPQS